MLRMVDCPACGAANSDKRDACFSCQALLRPTSPVQTLSRPESASQRTCVQCSHSTVYAPRGVKMSFEQVWCTMHDKVTECCADGQECFAEAFSWKSNSILG